MPSDIQTRYCLFIITLLELKICLLLNTAPRISLNLRFRYSFATFKAIKTKAPPAYKAATGVIANNSATTPLPCDTLDGDCFLPHLEVFPWLPIL